MRFNIKSFITGFVLLFGSFTFAQNASVIRMEAPAALESGAFHTETLAKSGVMIFYESNEVNESSQRKWYFGLFDTQLKQVWLKFIPLRDGIQFMKSVRNGSMLHLLFRSVNPGKSGNEFYEIVNYNTRTEAFSNISGTIPDDAEINGFEAIDDKACLGLNLKKNHTDVLFINLNNGEIEVQTVEAENDSYIEKVLVDHKNKHFYVAVKYIKDKNSLEDKIIQYSARGALEKTFLISNSININSLRNFVLAPVTDQQLTFMGTYDIITGRTVDLKKAADDTEANSAGMFFLQFENNIQKTLNFYDFMSFDNIYGSLQGREMAYVKKTPDEDEKQKPEKTLSALFYFYAPAVIEFKKQYVFSIEVYKPFYTSETRMEYDFYGRPIPHTYQVFDGYIFYDLVIASVSKNGQLIWNNDFEINSIKTYFLKQQVAVFPDGDFLSMAYVSDGHIYSQTIDGPVDLSKEKIPIESQYAKDWLTEDENNTVAHWYDDYFLVYGYQKIKNRSLGDQSTRTVFFANKVAYK
jgi:hypothetical protein